MYYRMDQGLNTAIIILVKESGLHSNLNQYVPLIPRKSGRMHQLRSQHITFMYLNTKKKIIFKYIGKDGLLYIKRMVSSIAITDLFF